MQAPTTPTPTPTPTLTLTLTLTLADTQRYARTIANSRRIRWDIDQDVIRQRRFDPAEKGPHLRHFVLSKRTWAVLALTCHIELVSQAHYRASIDTAPDLSALFKDIFRYHWREESQHAILDELEWIREDRKITREERDAAIDDLVALIGAVTPLMYAMPLAGGPVPPMAA